jgi:hypothetical protein
MGSVEMVQDRAACGCLRGILGYGNTYSLNKFSDIFGEARLWDA